MKIWYNSTMRSFISSFFITLGLITIIIGSELFISYKTFYAYEEMYQVLSTDEKQKFEKFYVNRLHNNFHGYFAKFLGFPKNAELKENLINKNN